MSLSGEAVDDEAALHHDDGDAALHHVGRERTRRWGNSPELGGATGAPLP